jgi:hypothetical protein
LIRESLPLARRLLLHSFEPPPTSYQICIRKYLAISKVIPLLGHIVKYLLSERQRFYYYIVTKAAYR